MITSFEISLFLYFTSFLFFLNQMSNWSFWICLEANMVLFILLLFFSLQMTKTLELYDFSLFYFLVQSLGTIFFLYFTLNNSSFTFFGLMFFVLFSLSLKSGFVPFHSWVYKSISCLTPLGVTLLLSFQKIPVFFGMLSIPSSFSFFILFPSLILGSIYISLFSNWSLFLVSSSLYSSYWFCSIFYLSLSSFFQFLLIYSIFLFLFSIFYYMQIEINSTDSVTCSLFFLFFLGLPPVSIFFFKFYIFSFLFDSMGLLHFLLVWLFVLVSILGYFKFIYSFFSSRSSLYMVSLSSGSKVLFLCLGILGFPQILFFKDKLYSSCWVHTSNKGLFLMKELFSYLQYLFFFLD